MKNKDEELKRNDLESTILGDVTNHKYHFESEDKDYTYSCTVSVSQKKKPPENKFDELIALVQSLEKLDCFARWKSPKPKRVSKLVKDLAIERGYQFERQVGADYFVYTKRIGDECDILIDYCGKIAYTRLDLRKPLKHHPAGNVLEILPQKKEIKKFAKTFYAIHENCFLGDMGQRLLSYFAIIMLSGVTGCAYGFDNPAYISTSVSYGALGTFSAFIGVHINHYLYKKKVKHAFKKYEGKIVYDKEALKKGLGYIGSK